jgi:hypothetical protein
MLRAGSRRCNHLAWDVSALPDSSSLETVVVRNTGLKRWRRKTAQG